MSEMKTLLDEFNDLANRVMEPEKYWDKFLTVDDMKIIVTMLKILVDDKTRWEPVKGFGEVNLDEDPASFLRGHSREQVSTDGFWYGI